MIEMKTDAMKDILQFTTGCAIAVMLTTDSCRAVSFPTIKNKAHWEPFAAANTLALQKWLEVKAHTSFRWRISASATKHNTLSYNDESPTAPKELAAFSY